MLEKERFRLVSKMIKLRYELLWLSKIVTVQSTRCTKRAEFPMTQQIRQEATSDFSRACIGKTCNTKLLIQWVCIECLFSTRPPAESQEFHSREEGQNLCPQEAYILIGWQTKDNEYINKQSITASDCCCCRRRNIYWVINRGVMRCAGDIQEIDQGSALWGGES